MTWPIWLPCEITLKNMGKLTRTKPQQNTNHVHNSWDLLQMQHDGSVQNCLVSIINALEMLQSCTKPSRWFHPSVILCKTSNHNSLKTTWIFFPYPSLISLYPTFPIPHFRYTPISDHFVNAPGQWETTLQCDVVSHWLDAFTKWSLPNLPYPHPPFQYTLCP